MLKTTERRLPDMERARRASFHHGQAAAPSLSSTSRRIANRRELVTRFDHRWRHLELAHTSTTRSRNAGAESK
jgi:hypothetical protein